MESKLPIISLATTAFLAIAPPVSSTAHPRPVHCRMVVQPYSYYQGPDGTYDSLADFTRDLWGVPCGVNCTRAAMARWARAAHCAG